MKTLQTDYTTPEQSKRLLELGVPANSANYYYLALGFGNGYEKTPSICDNSRFSSNIDLPCWSTGRLIEIFELCYTDRVEEPVWYNHPRKGSTIVRRVLWDFENKKDRLDFSKLEG